MNLGEDPELVRWTAKTRGYRARIVLDPDGVAGRAYAVRGTPTVFLVARDRSIAGRAIGRRDWDSNAARFLLESLLGGTP